ncbi:MAG: hypothetical protein JWL67_2644 [Solirubrobacterales bacterium]|nr:hypothetical protein [Solirubrobacterales bacterium]
MLELRAALERALAGDTSCVIEAHGPRAANVELHRSVWDAVARALNP